MHRKNLAWSVGAEASYSRLEKLIAERLKPGADKAEIDERIWNLFGEEWAILFTDLSGFSRHVAEFGVIHFLQTIFESERLFVPLIEQHGGILLKIEGDSMMVIFRNVERALQCVLEMQQATTAYNEEREEAEKVLLCAGIGYGRVLRIGDSDVFGAEVNAAGKLGEDIAATGEVLITDAVHSALDESVKKQYSYEPLEVIPSGATGAYRVLY